MNDDLSWKARIAIATPYALLLATLYLWGYWGEFELNVLEFLSLTDLFNHALLPLVSTVSLFLTLGTISAVLETDNAEPFQDYRAGLILCTIMVPISIVLAVKFRLSWYPFLLFSSMTAAIAISRIAYFKCIIPRDGVRLSILLFAVLFIPLAHARGVRDAKNIENGQGSLIVDPKSLQLQSDEQHPVGYVGHIGNSFVLYESEKAALVILKDDGPNGLTLIKNPRAQERDALPDLDEFSSF
jgi:hypothetical protein